MTKKPNPPEQQDKNLNHSEEKDTEYEIEEMVFSRQNYDTTASYEMDFDKIKKMTITSGAMIEVKKPIGDLGDIITLSTKIEVGGKEEYIAIPCSIRNVIHKDTDSYYKHGLEFQLLEQKDHFVLYGYVYEQMINNMKK